MRNLLLSNSNHLKHQFLVLAQVQLARDFEMETQQYSRNPAQQAALKDANHIALIFLLQAPVIFWSAL